MSEYEYRFTYMDRLHPERRQVYRYTFSTGLAKWWEFFDYNATLEEGEEPREPNLTGFDGLLEATRLELVEAGHTDVRMERRAVGPWETVATPKEK